MKKRQNRRERRLHFVPLVAGAYGALLGLGLTVIGFSEIAEGIGIIRLLIGFAITCFGLYGVWDGVRDVLRPEEKSESPVVHQFILRDMYGNRSSNVTPEVLQEQVESLTKNEQPAAFHIEILPPLSVKEQGMLKQVSCVYEDKLTLVAFFEMGEGGGRICPDMEPDMAKEWLRQLLSGTLDFSGWQNAEVTYRQDETASGWHQLLVIFGESWHDEHKFFSAKDVELAVEGVYDGKYQRVVLEWGFEGFEIFPGRQNELLVVWYTGDAEKGKSRFYAKEGTAIQVKFWLVNGLNSGFSGEKDGWNEITDQIEKEWKKNGKVF